MSNSALARMIFGFLRSDNVKASSSEGDSAADAEELPDQSSTASPTMFPPLPPAYPKKPPNEAAFQADIPNAFAAVNSAEPPARERPATPHVLPLVWPEDRPLLPRAVYLALQQYQSTAYRGIVGVECLHCTRRQCSGCTLSIGESGLYSFDSETSMRDNLHKLLDHLTSCTCCPRQIRQDFHASAKDLGRNEHEAVAFHRVWCRLHENNYLDFNQKTVEPLDNSQVSDIAANAISQSGAVEKPIPASFCIGSAVEEANDDVMMRLREDWEDDFQETNKYAESLNVTVSGSHALLMAKQKERMDAVTQYDWRDELQEKKAASSQCSEEMEQSVLTPKVIRNEVTTNMPHLERTEESTKASGRCVDALQEKARKMKKLRDEALLITSFVDIETIRADRKMFDINQRNPSFSVVHGLDDFSAMEYTKEEETLAHSHRGNRDTATSRHSFSLSDFYSAQYGDHLFDLPLENKFTFTKSSDSNTATNGDLPLQESSISQGTQEPFTVTTRNSNQSLRAPPTKPSPRTVIDFAAAARSESTDSRGIISCHMTSKPKSPLDLLSTVCNTPSVKFSSMRCHGSNSIACSKFQLFDKVDGNGKVYPLNNINEDDQKAFMLTYRDISPMISLSEASGTDLLLHAADTEDYTSHQAIRKRNVATKRKLSEASPSTSQPISLEELGVMIKKVKDVPKNMPEQTAPQSDVKPSSDARSLHAFLLADRALRNPTTSKELLLSMAIGRAPNGRGPPVATYQPPGAVLSKAFLWSMYPSLEAILRENMEEYYEMSTTRCMTKAQLDFNNKLVNLIKDEASSRGWVWGEGYGDDKQIRNRIRCYYKSHIQNAKKRLMTMLRNPKKPSHIEALAEHFHIIKDRINIFDDCSTVPDLKSCGDLSSSSTSSTVDEFDGDKNNCHTEVSFGFDSSFDKSFDWTELAEESSIQ
ncbi:hypothetical protein HJC23_002770 [Cyclotella cryptica]|uniref:Uncharacterized protein n=1 Tax=Cyclotella cryptica TaxID=29204 RepID=A0ABD3PH98_9STRA|eukprot:CCRYP_015010-RA/>CCRYP_015010-RA protein AED:0.01 eAED:0.01 QI:244/1/1/1/1/1/2/339/931